MSENPRGLSLSDKLSKKKKAKKNHRAPPLSLAESSLYFSVTTTRSQAVVLLLSHLLTKGEMQFFILSPSLSSNKFSQLGGFPLGAR